MGRRGMPGRRRQLIQLDNAPKTSYLTQTGCYRPDDIFIESKNIVKSSLSLVCDYTGSDSESEEDSDKGESDSNSNRNGDVSVKKDDVNSGNEVKDSLHAEMLEIVGAKIETPSDIFRREFNAYQKETAAPSYNREFIAFQKETSPSLSTTTSTTTETVTTTTTQPQKAIVAPKENSPTSVDLKSVSDTTETSESVSKSSDIDSQVASFLAEIDALGEDAEVKDKDIGAEDDKEVVSVVDSTKNDQPLEPDEKETTETTETSGEAAVSVVASYKSSGDSSSSEEEPIVWPEEPVSEWQQCHDESTQHYYYWNINSNEVTWEIPPEFTQYLLLYKEYELTISRLIKEGKTKPKKKKTKSKRDLKKSGRDKSESSVITTDDKSVSETAPPPELQSDNVVDEKEKSPAKETDVEPKLLRETSSPDITENTQCSPGNSENINNEEKTMESDSSISLTVGSSPVAESLETEADKSTEGTAGIADENGANTTNDANCNSSSSSTSSCSSNNESTVSTPNISDQTIEMCKKKFKARMHRDDTVSNKQEQQTTTELNTETTSASITSNKEASAASDSEQSNIDIDEVDRELELALERKVNELRRLEEEEKQFEAPDRHHMKRKYKEAESERIATRNSSDEECCVSKPLKKSKTHKHGSKRTKEKKESSSSKRSENSSKKRSSHKDHQSKKESRSKSSRSLKSHLEESLKNQESDEKLKGTVMDLNQLVMDKMDFLEIDINKPSKLQVLLVQLKTRSSDWQAGGLSISYFFERLQEANQQIIQFEKSGAPTGWSVCWDRTYKRYFYCNNTTGHSQWDYPEMPTKEELNSVSETMQQSLTLALSSTPPPPPPTPPPTPSTSGSSSSSSSSSSSTLATTTTTKTTLPVHESTKTASPVRPISPEQKVNNGQESAEITKCSDNLKKEKKKRKLEKLAWKYSKSGSASKKTHIENLHMRSSKDFDSELCVYPGEPPPPGTEVSKQHSLQHLEEVKLSKTGEEDLEEVMKLAAVLAPAGMSLVSSTPLSKIPSLESSEHTSTLDINDDMELDPDETLPSSVHLLSTHSSSYKSTALSSNSNGHHLFPLVDAANCIQNNSAVISKPPQYKTRPAVSSDTVVGITPTSNSDSSAVYASKTNPTAISSMDCFYLSKSSVKVTPPDSATASNSPISQETNDIVETVKPQPKEKKRKKDKVITSTNLTLKKKNVSSLVQKWQKVKKEVEKEDELARHEFSDDD